MSEASNQSRQEQYSPIKVAKGQMRYRTPPKMSDGAGKDPVQPNNRGPQGDKG